MIVSLVLRALMFYLLFIFLRSLWNGYKLLSQMRANVENQLGGNPRHKQNPSSPKKEKRKNRHNDDIEDVNFKEI